MILQNGINKFLNLIQLGWLTHKNFLSNHKQSKIYFILQNLSYLNLLTYPNQQIINQNQQKMKKVLEPYIDNLLKLNYWIFYQIKFNITSEEWKESIKESIQKISLDIKSSEYYDTVNSDRRFNKES